MCAYNIYKDISYGNCREQTLDLCLPKGCTETGLILWIHGGAWTFGDKDIYQERMPDCCARLGYASAAINYRFLSESVGMTDILDDITLALNKIQTTAKEQNITLTGMMLTGHSAGGHLAELYAYKCASISPIVPKAVAAQSGPADLTDKSLILHNDLGDPNAMTKLLSNACRHTVTPEDWDEATPYLAKISPVYYVTENVVPTFLCHGQRDTVVPYNESVTLNDRLEACGVVHDFLPFPHSNHGLRRDPDCSAQAQVLFERYAKQYLT
ncbi:MAG: alpha/beta hydrolase fold domain-containing protein [Acutalibacteraceae bacterium]